MMKNIKIALTILNLTIVILLSTNFLFSQIHNQSRKLDYQKYAEVLATYVNEEGLVDYEGLKENRDALDEFLISIENLYGRAYHGGIDEDKIAFWINIYNALTLKAVIDNYPIKSSFVKSMIYPKNSIRQISGVRDKLEFTVLGKEITLDHIKHQILRKEFSEPRIHVALVCASKGCPRLRDELYIGSKLDNQLEDQVQNFLSNPAQFEIDTGNSEVHLSSIFDWFGEDFIAKYGTGDKFEHLDLKERAVINFVSQYLDTEDRKYLLENEYDIKYTGYDWSLNDQ